MWSLNSYTKVVHGGRGPYGVDWISEYENGTNLHSAEPRHATIAITETSIKRMKVPYFDIVFLEVPNSLEFCDLFYFGNKEFIIYIHHYS